MSLQEKIQGLPEKSGVYIMRDIGGTIIYIGKAVVLKNRVRQYFTNSQKIPKVQQMVENIADFDYIITLSEKDALSMEANLIRKHKPKYNILLKDDRSSPYIRIDLKQRFPTIEVTRHVKRDGAKYFGPYFSGLRVADIVEIIKSAYRMRACPKNYYSTKRECLNYHIKLCLAPCLGRVSHEQYSEVVRNVMVFLSGREDTAERLISDKMNFAAENEDFERAIEYRNQLEMIKKLKERNLTDLHAQDDIDSFFFEGGNEQSVVSVAIVRLGKMMGVKNYMVNDASSSDTDSLVQFITQYYSLNSDSPSDICLGGTEFDVEPLREFLATIFGRKIDISFPKKGIKKKLVNMAKENATDFLSKNCDKARREYDMTVGANETLSKILGINGLKRIECYDISNISGVDKVASGVVFIDGKASKSDYRRYKIKTVEGANDFASMAEVIKRRLDRANSGDKKFSSLPQLIVVDGGKGQLSSAYSSMLNAGLDIPLVGLAEKQEEIYTLLSSEPVLLKRDSLPLLLLQRIRDEAHRFALTYHQNLRAKRYKSKLDDIKGVGAKKRKILLNAFERIDDIKSASVDTLAAIKGIDRRTAESIYNFFNNKEG